MSVRFSVVPETYILESPTHNWKQVQMPMLGAGIVWVEHISNKYNQAVDEAHAVV